MASPQGLPGEQDPLKRSNRRTGLCMSRSPRVLIPASWGLRYVQPEEDSADCHGDEVETFLPSRQGSGQGQIL